LEWSKRKVIILNRKKLSKLGIPNGTTMKTAIRLVAQAGQKGMKKRDVDLALTAMMEDPGSVPAGDHFAPLARMLVAGMEDSSPKISDLSPASWRQWVPIGGVLAVEDAVIPYAVGSDIACRMCMTVLDMPAADLASRTEELGHALEKETVFGGGAGFTKRHEHKVLDADWGGTKLLARLKDKAWQQLGSSGGGNHFVEFGQYVALLSHSGSRNAGNTIGQHYSTVARELHPELPPQLWYLAWLDLQSEPGQEYWQAMHLMGEYAQANHEVIHGQLLKRLRAKGLVTVQNHHNFAWREEHGGRQVIVHRKGAIPAHEGQLGIIPGNMAAAGYVVRGRGYPEALCSAAHGAGRRLSRSVAKKELGWGEARKLLEQKGVTLLSAGLDETPLAYKNIQEVMAAQTDLVDIVARFQPKVVKMGA